MTEFTTVAAAVALTFGATSAFADAHKEAEVQTEKGNVVWSLSVVVDGDNLTILDGANPAGNGNTDRASKGLVRAVGAGGLTLEIED